MKKKLVTILLLAALSASSAACGGKGPESNEPPETSDESSGDSEMDRKEPKQESEKESNSDESKEEDTEEASAKTLEDIEKYLLDKGVLSGERVRMGAELIGGIDGFKYKDSIGEVYEYDTESEEYQKLANGEEIPLKGMDGFSMKAVSVNGKFVLFGDGIPQELIDAFNSFE